MKPIYDNPRALFSTAPSNLPCFTSTIGLLIVNQSLANLILPLLSTFRIRVFRATRVCILIISNSIIRQFIRDLNICYQKLHLKVYLNGAYHDIDYKLIKILSTNSDTYQNCCIFKFFANVSALRVPTKWVLSASIKHDMYANITFSLQHTDDKLGKKLITEFSYLLQRINHI